MKLLAVIRLPAHPTLAQEHGRTYTEADAHSIASQIAAKHELKAVVNPAVGPGVAYWHVEIELEL